MISFRDLLGSLDRTAFGTWIKLPTVESIELVALAGFDFVVLDMEHAPLDIGIVHQLIGAANGCRVPALVRVPDRGPTAIARVLDSGAAGVLVPHVDTVAQVRAVIAASRFPPEGTRGFGPTVRAGSWGAATTKYGKSGEQVVVIPQLESRQAVDAVHELGAVDGIGALFVGPADLAVATGLSSDSAEFGALLDRVESTSKELGVPIGTATGADSIIARDLAQRYDFVMLSNDAAMLGQTAADLLAAARGG